MKEGLPEGLKNEGYQDYRPELFAGRENESRLISRRVEAVREGPIDLSLHINLSPPKLTEILEDASPDEIHKVTAWNLSARALYMDLLRAARRQATDRDYPGHPLYPLVEFVGFPGVGKSCLLSHLAHEYCLPLDQGPCLGKPTFSAKIDFGNFRTLSDSYPLLQSLAAQLREQLAKAEPGLTFPDLSGEINLDAENLTKFIAGLTDRYVPILVFDATEKADEELLDWLENQVVYPIIRTDRTIFIFSGRIWHRWKIFEVRRRVEPIELGLMGEEEIASQLERLGLERPEELVRKVASLSFGHPQTTAVLAQELIRLAGKGATKTQLEENLDSLAKAIRQRIIEESFLAQVPLGWRERLMPLLGTVSIVRKFHPAFLGEFAIRFLGEEYGQKPPAFFLDAIHDVWETTLVQWSSAAGGYILEPVVRKIMAKNLSMRDPAKFQRRHQDAGNLYDDWIKRFPRNAVGFLIERTFHRNWALQGDKTQREIGNTLALEFDRILRYVEKHPDVQWDLLDMAAALKKGLAEDEELRETVGAETFAQLEKLANRFLKRRPSPWVV